MPSTARAYDAGATDFIPKPLNWLSSTIARHPARQPRLEGAPHQERLIIAKEAAEAANR